MYVVETILDKVQELIGAPLGSFYSISSRMATADGVQREMVRETNALVADTTLFVGTGESSFSEAFSSAFGGSSPNAGVLVLPGDFLSFASRRPVVTRGNINTQVVVVPPRHLDLQSPTWRTDAAVAGAPQYLVKDGRFIGPYPFPEGAFSLNFNYVKAPAPLVSLTQVPFDGREDLNEFSQGIAYRMASDIMLSQAPETSAYLRKLYQEEVNRMRHFIRVDPQKDYHIYPAAGSYYASR